MKCELTDAGRDLRNGIIFVVVSLIFILTVMVIVGWIQLNILGLNLVPDAPMESPLEYYLLSGMQVVTAVLVSSIFLFAMYNNFIKGEKLPKLFTCKGGHNEEDTINTRHVQEL
jgi:hypothetical protein